MLSNTIVSIWALANAVIYITTVLLSMLASKRNIWGTWILTGMPLCEFNMMLPHLYPACTKKVSIANIFSVGVDSWGISSSWTKCTAASSTTFLAWRDRSYAMQGVEQAGLAEVPGKGEITRVNHGWPTAPTWRPSGTPFTTPGRGSCAGSLKWCGRWTARHQRGRQLWQYQAFHQVGSRPRFTSTSTPKLEHQRLCVLGNTMKYCNMK